MKHLKIRIIIAILLNLFGVKSFAYDISVENKDGVTIYYNYVNDGKELSVTYGNGNHKYKDHVTIPETVTYKNRTRTVVSIGESAFWANSELKSVTMCNTIKSIGTQAFYSCKNLNKLTIPDAVESIGEEAFKSSGLTLITMGKGLKHIGKNIFSNCKPIIIVKDIASWCECEFDTPPFENSYVGNSTHLQLNIDEKTELTNLVIPNGVKKINPYAFGCCKSLKSITIPNSIESIGFGAFISLKNLEIINIGNGVTSIGNIAFRYCEKLNSLIIPNNVRTIGKRAFSDCRQLKYLILGYGVSEISSAAFDNINNLETITSYIKEPFVISNDTFTKETFYNTSLFVPKGTAEKYKNTGGWQNFLWIEEGVPSAIEKVVDDSIDIKKYYNLQGRLSLQPHKGLNIIMSGGTKKRIYVK